MKTPDESKCGMECIRTNVERLCIKPEKGQCPRCKQLVDESLAYIQQLESRLAQVERERDAAIRDCSMFPCQTCADRENGDLCYTCLVHPSTERSNYEWRGVCPENTKED